MKHMFSLISFLIGLLVFTGALMLLLPALNFLLFQIGIAALEWSPWFILITIVGIVCAVLGFRFGGSRTFGWIALSLNLIALIVIGWQTIRATTGTIVVKSTMPVANIGSFRLGKFLGDNAPRGALLERDHVYATVEGQALKLDIYNPPTTPNNAPVLVIIHGGSWRGGDKGEIPAFSERIAGRGYVVFDVAYRLAPEYKFPAAISDVKCAIGYIKRNAAQFGIDPNSMVLLGRSAGAQIALVAGYSDATLAPSCDAPDTTVRGIIGYYAPTRMDYYDIIKPQLSPGALRDYLGGAPEGREEIYRLAQAKSWINATTPPTLLLHGGRDQFVRTRDPIELYDALAAAQRSAIYVEIPWANHGFDYNVNGVSNQRVQPIVEQFLEEVTGKN